MEKIPLPSNISAIPGAKPNEAVISIQPCHPGFGTTLGNALRRVLLSSLPGGAVTAFKIKGASHEFTALPHVAEDLVEISLNLKQLRLKVHSDQPVRIELKAKGEKKVTGKDIKATSDVEIISKDLVIATLTDKDAEFEMELIVAQGRGYVPTEMREKEVIEAELIAIDAIYTPVRNVGFKIENVRVGQMTNYENLVLTIETDGSIVPLEALTQANDILIEHFKFIEANAENANEALAAPETTEEVAEDKVVETDSTEETTEEKKPRKPRAKKADK